MPDNSLVGAGVLAGDTAVVLLAADYQTGDLVLAHTPEGLNVYQYRATRSGRVRLRTLQFRDSINYLYSQREAVVLGRVVQFLCRDKPVQLLIELRGA
jgi:SOS-response transcriptional repressor LexA